MNIIFMLFFLLLLDVLLLTIFYTKERINLYENKMYSGLIICNAICIVLEILCNFSVNWSRGISEVFVRFFLSGLLIFGGTLSVYDTIILFHKEHKLYKYISTIIFGIIGLTIIPVPFLSLKFMSKGTSYFCEGAAVNYSVVIGSIIMLYNIFIIVYNHRKIGKKLLPIFTYILLLTLSIVIHNIDPTIPAINASESFVCLLMFFTIENPDIRLVEYEKKERELAQSANEAKSAFLSSMSHELRTPLNAIVGLSEDMLSYKDRVPSEVKEDCDDIVNASNTLLEIIGNILDISKIEGGKLELIETDYLPKEEIESLLKIMRTKVEEKDLKFNVYIDPNIPECLYGDRLRIKQIINNFLSNAIKYTESGSIDFGARWVNDSLELKVRDTGRGIKKEDLGKLFEKFERLHVEKTSAVQGTGLGLAITKNLIDLMGGTIKVDSEFGVGSTFDVIIPQKIGNKDNIVREALTVEERKEIDYSGKKVLIVDDNKLNIKVLKKAIQAFNFEIDECYNGEEALSKINNNSYDLIFMDIMMPVMGGEEAMGKLKQNPEFKTPVLALTADATTGAKERYLSIGFIDYLAKPFSRDTIAQKLENVFKDMN